MVTGVPENDAFNRNVFQRGIRAWNALPSNAKVRVVDIGNGVRIGM